MSETSLSRFLELIVQSAPEEDLRNRAYQCLTRLRVLQSGRADPKYAILLETQLVTKADELAVLFGMEATKPMHERVQEAIREALSEHVTEESVARKMSWEDCCSHVLKATGKTVTSDVDCLDGLNALDVMAVLRHMRTQSP